MKFLCGRVKKNSLRILFKLELDALSEDEYENGLLIRRIKDKAVEMAAEEISNRIVYDREKVGLAVDEILKDVTFKDLLDREVKEKLRKRLFDSEGANEVLGDGKFGSPRYRLT